ncbi:MAG: thermonuclease family protein [bacterium]
MTNFDKAGWGGTAGRAARGASPGWFGGRVGPGGGRRGLLWIAAAGLALGAAVWSPPGRELALGAGPAALRDGAKIVLRTPPLHVNDGDTFEADLDGDGRLELPGERVRLLFVDTPELHKSRKGQDLKHGVPARAFLAAALARPPLTLLPVGRRKYDRYGRLLAVVMAGGLEVNLALVRAGHSYFDTRFSFPSNYGRYAEAEGEAFQKRRGIWGDPHSREAYLARLRKELKTPRAPKNPLYAPGLRETASLHPQSWLGRFLRIRGRLLERRIYRNGARLLLFQGAPRPLAVYVGRQVGRKLATDFWPLGASFLLDGFVTRYRGRPQLTLHYGEPAKTIPQKGAAP